MNKTLYKIIGILLFIIALLVIIYDVKEYNFYQNFTYFVERYNRKALYNHSYYKNNNKKIIKTEIKKINESKIKNNNLFSKIDINHADIYKLMGLPGIGSKIAERIIRYRETNGSFESFEDLMKVNGIGTKKIEDLKRLIVIK